MIFKMQKVEISSTIYTLISTKYGLNKSLLACNILRGTHALKISVEKLISIQNYPRTCGDKSNTRLRWVLLEVI